nr:unnamed protein product [Callosobruchus chinensis]
MQYVRSIIQDTILYFQLKDMCLLSSSWNFSILTLLAAKLPNQSRNV